MNVPGASAHTLFSCSLQKRRESIRPIRGDVWALDFFCEDFLEDVLVQGQVGHQLLQTVILFFELLEPPQLTHAHSTILFLPVVEGRIADAHLPANIRRRFSCFYALQRVDNLLITMPLLLHGSVLSLGPHQSNPSNRFLSSFPEAGHIGCCVRVFWLWRAREGAGSPE